MKSNESGMKEHFPSLGFMAQESFGVLTVCGLKANLEEEKFGDKD